MDRQRPKPDIAQTLSADQAADMLGHSPRHVRRLIARGDLEGTREPYRTTRAAVDAYRFKQRGKGADMSTDMDRTQVHRQQGPADQRDELVDVLVSHVERLARENGWLQAEVRRLEAELAQAKREARGDGRQREGPHAVGRHSAGVWGRVGLWLRG